MEDHRITPDGINMIRQSLPGPIVLRVCFPHEFQSQNQKLQKKNSQKLFLQLRDGTTKATGYLVDDAFKNLHDKIADNDLIEIYRYEAQEIKPGHKIVKVSIAELIETENGVEEPSNSLDEIKLANDPTNKVLKPTRDEPEPVKIKTALYQSNVSTAKSTPFEKGERGFQPSIFLLSKSPLSEKNQSDAGTDRGMLTPTRSPDQNRLSPFPKNPSTFNQRNPSAGAAAKTLFPSSDKQTPSSPQSSNLTRSPNSSVNKKRNDDNMYTEIGHLALWEKSWTVKARVYMKGTKVVFKKGNSSDSLFTINLIDKDNNEISATFFSTGVVDKHYDQIEVGKIYSFNGGQVKTNNKKFSKSKNNLQLTFDAKSNINIVELPEDNRFPYGFYTFTKIQDLYTKADDASVDVVGIIGKVGPIGSITTAEGRSIPMRKIEIMDDSLKPIEVTLWSYKTAMSLERFDMIMICPAKIKIFSGVRTLTVPNFSEVKVNNLPEIPFVKSLKDWFANRDAKETKETISKAILDEHTKTVEDLQTHVLDENQSYWVRASVAYFYDEKLTFKACPHCKKHLEPEKEHQNSLNASAEASNPNSRRPSPIKPVAEGGSLCPKCGNAYNAPLKNLMLRVKIADATGSETAIAFGPVVEKLIDQESEAIFELEEKNEKFDFSGCLYKEYKMQIKCHGNLNNQKRLMINKVLKLDYPGECQDIFSRLEIYKSIAPKKINNLYDIF